MFPVFSGLDVQILGFSLCALAKVCGEIDENWSEDK